MKKIYVKFTILLCLIFVFAMGTMSLASANIYIPTETTQVYEKWQELTKEEKNKYIEPQPYSLNLSNSIKLSEYNKITRKIGASQLESSYNTYNEIKFKIKNQLNTNECWAFATTTALEINTAKLRNKTIELSPRHIDYATSKTFTDGINKKGYNREIGMGNFYISFGYCTSGKGPVLEQDMPFENNENKVNLSQIDKNPVLKLENYVKFANIYKNHLDNGNIKYTNGGTLEYTESQAIEVRRQIKEHIKKYGSVTAYTYLGQNMTNCLNLQKIQEGKANTIAYFNKDNTKLYNHAITIVGWDDTYSKENFNDNNKPKNDGAYLILNSSAGANGALSAMYVSYDDIWIEYDNFAVVSTQDINYDNLYQYDEYGYNIALPLTNSQTGEKVKVGYEANVFETQKKTNKDEYLNEVSVYIASTSNVDIYVNTENDNKEQIVQVASAGILNPGYHTIKLSTPLKLIGDKFVVAAKLSSNEVNISTETNMLSNGSTTNFWDNATSEKGQSYISLDGKIWNDINDSIKDSNICIKAFTTYQEKANIEVTGITLDKNNKEIKEGETTTLISTIMPSNATNKNVIWESDNEDVAIVSETGVIKAIKEGKTTITAKTEDGNKVAKCLVTVKGKIDENDEVYYPDNNEIEKGDYSVAQGVIPQTGVKIDIFIFIGITIIISICIYIKVRKIKNI